MKSNDCIQGVFCCCILDGVASPDALSHAMPSSLSLLLLSTPAFVFSPLVPSNFSTGYFRMIAFTYR